MVDENAAQRLRADVLAKLGTLNEALAAYTAATGWNPEFILGPQVRSTVIDRTKLTGCRLYSDRSEIIRDMANDGNVVEVGTQTGLFAECILSTHSRVKLYTIDVDYSEFKFDRLDPYIKAGRLETIAGSSWEELDKFPDGFFSWLYIDASHHFDGVQRDLKTAKRCVRVGGHIICNDYTAWSPFEARPYGVLQAVNEFLAVEDFLVTHFALHPFGYNDIAMCKQS